MESANEALNLNCLLFCVYNMQIRVKKLVQLKYDHNYALQHVMNSRVKVYSNNIPEDPVL